MGISIVLATHNGSRFLGSQLESIAAQSCQATEVVMTDDLSTDTEFTAMQKILEKYPNVRLIRNNPKLGFARNFLSGLRQCSDEASYFAYADQDDVWHPDKLERAIQFLVRIPSDQAALYGSRTKLIDEKGAHLGYSPLFSKPPHFKNALVQNIMGGNTMVFNKKARDLILESTQNCRIVSHDWWTYLIVTGSGGAVCYDPVPSVEYRQHACNVIGSNRGLLACFQRVFMLLKGQFKEWNAVHTRALQQNRHLLTPANRKILDLFCDALHAKVSGRVFRLRKSKVYRQDFASNASLFAAAILGRI